MSDNAAFQYLLSLSHQVRASSPELPEQKEVQDSWGGIGFSLLGRRFIVPLGEIVEMLNVPETTRLPGTQSWVTGLANVRGRLLPIFDLEAFFGARLSSNRGQHRVLVIELGDLYAGLVVSQVFGMQSIAKNAQAMAIDEDLAIMAPYSDGAYEHESLVWSTFSPFKLIRDPRFFNAAAA